MKTRAWRGFLVVGVLVSGGAWLLPMLVRSAPLASRIGCYELLSAAAVVAIVVGVGWHRPTVRLPWLLFAAAQLVYFAADLTFYGYHQLFHDARYPAPADGLYLGHYPLFVAGLLVLLRRRSPGRDRDGLLDALIITTGVGLLAWVFVLGPYVDAAGLPLPVRAVSLAYPLMDLLVVAVAARLAVSGGARPPAYWLLLASLVGLLAADGWYALAQLHGSYQIGQLLDAGWLVSYVGWGAAALHPSMRTLSQPGQPPAARLSRARLAALALAALVAPAVLLFQAVRGQPIDAPVIAAASALLFGLTLLRMRRLAGQAAAQAERARLLHRLGAVIDASPVAIVELDRAGRVQLWNPAAERIYGWPPQEVLGRPHPASLEPGWPPLQPAAANGQGHTVRLELRHHRRDGTPIGVELSTAPLQTPSGEPAGMIGVAADISERKRLAEQLRHQALHDPLTDLANRALLQDRLEHALARLDRHGGLLAVLLLDLDAFKTVNDTLGHQVGDQLLTLVAERLRGAVRPSDTVARAGGDEFVVLVEDATSTADAVTATQRLLGALATPVALANRDIQVRASVGIAIAGPGAQPGDLVRDADVAMYQAKADGGSSFRVFDPSMRAEVVDRAELEADLRQALDRDQLRLRYQPIVELGSGRISGLEALVRWQHPTRGLLAPGSFIPLAEESGLLVAIGAWVLQHACQQTRHWQASIPGCGQLGISVNLSAVQLAQPHLADQVAQTLAATGLHARHLTLELTESLLIADVATTASTLAELDAIGVRLAIDDFGTGYSSLAYLRRLPVDSLKIDKAFVDEVASSPDAAALTHAIINLATTLGLGTVAEGIEQPDQLQRLRELGCQHGQGYYFAKPLDDQQLTTLLHTHAQQPLAPQPTQPATA
jgi:diguanylate cyclase (GGDEF)-like protein/PAS domain S-box-containing protein